MIILNINRYPIIFLKYEHNCKIININFISFYINDLFFDQSINIYL